MLRLTIPFLPRLWHGPHGCRPTPLAADAAPRPVSRRKRLCDVARIEAHFGKSRGAADA